LLDVAAVTAIHTLPFVGSVDDVLSGPPDRATTVVISVVSRQ